MKKTLMSIFFVNIFFIIFSNTSTVSELVSERVYCFRIFSHYTPYEIYCTKNPMGYYKYEIEVNSVKLYLTYEGIDFYNKSFFDEKPIIGEIYVMNVWTNNRGEMLRLKRKFGPVIEKNRERKNWDYGYGPNY